MEAACNCAYGLTMAHASQRLIRASHMRDVLLEQYVLM